MKATNGWKLLACAGLVAGLAGTVVGQEPRRGGRGLLEVLDRNGNGKLEPEEIDLAVASLRTLDKNKDGEITIEEIFGPEGTPGRPPGRSGEPGGAVRRPQDVPDFGRLDTDGDGKISREEAPERIKDRFDEVDTNKDGYFDKDEQNELIQRMRERFQQGGPRRPGQPGPGGGPESAEGEGGVEKPKRPETKE